jgi:hypothetical protein
MKWFSQIIQILLFVYPVGDTVITSCPVIFSWNQDTIIIILGTITTGGIALPSAEMLLIIVRERRFLGTPTYISFIPIGTTTSSPARQAI